MSKKALVVDSDFFFVEFISEVLEKKGYEVIKAYSAKEGISKLEEGPVKVFFLDIIMPKADGKKLIEYARMKFRDERFPVIAVSGTIIEQMDKLDEIGADYYIAKGPVESMADHIAKCLEMIEEDPFPSKYENKLIDFGNIFPRQPTSGLIELVNFQWAVIESLGLGIIVVDKDTRVININFAALDIIEKSIVDVLNCHVTALFPKEERPLIVEALKRVVHNQELKKTAFSIFVSSREIRTIVSVLMIDGEIEGWIMALESINITEV